MGHGLHKVYTYELASGVTTATGYIDFGRSYSRVFLQIPTMASGDIYIKAAAEYDGTVGTFFRVMREQGNTATVHQTFMIGSTITNLIVPIPVAGLRYIKIENSSGATDTTTVFKILCGD